MYENILQQMRQYYSHPHIGFVSCSQNNLLQIQVNFTSTAAGAKVCLCVARCDLRAQGHNRLHTLASHTEKPLFFSLGQ